MTYLIIDPSDPRFSRDWLYSSQEILDELSVSESMPSSHYAWAVPVAISTLAVAYYNDQHSSDTQMLLEHICLCLDYAEEKALSEIGPIVELVLRCQIYVATYDQGMLARLNKFYPLINKEPIPNNLDLLLAYQLLFGYTNRMEQLLSSAIASTDTNLVAEQMDMANYFRSRDRQNFEDALNRYQTKRENLLRTNPDSTRGDWLDFFRMTVSNLATF